MTHPELIAAYTAARQSAHDAPLAEWSRDHRGHSAIVHHTYAWANRSREMLILWSEMKRRGLLSPDHLQAEGIK